MSPLVFGAWLEDGQVLAQFEVTDLRPVLVPLQLLVGDEVLEDVVTQRLAYEFAFFGQLDGVVQAVG